MPVVRDLSHEIIPLYNLVAATQRRLHCAADFLSPVVIHSYAVSLLNGAIMISVIVVQ